MNSGIDGPEVMPRPKSFLDEALRALEASNHGTGESALIQAVQALVWATLSVAEETSRVQR